ncbi:MAG: glycosyltransferase [Rhodospirillales bacterium]|nr:glycosyltransferase [Rhodospirillales bacterium]
MIAETILTIAAGVSLTGWIYLTLFHGQFWRCDQYLPEGGAEPPEWPGVAVVIPARNEAETIAAAVGSHLAQDYPGPCSVIVVDDQSTDGTAKMAGKSVRVVAGAALPGGWTGKMWAVSQGLDCVNSFMPDAKYVLLSDADIVHPPDNLRLLVNQAEKENFALVSQMVLLNAQSIWERILIPAFVFFFQMLYPFRWVNNPARKIAAAAGGCMLVKRETLDQMGGITAIRDRVIDDCAVAALIKPAGPIWLGLTARTLSLRKYDSLSEIWSMVTRTAFVQLRHSVLYLGGAVFGMILVYLVPPVATFVGAATGTTGLFALGFTSWLIMAICYAPALKLYSQQRWTSVLLPISALLYTAMTIDSARKFMIGSPPVWRERQTLNASAHETD